MNDYEWEQPQPQPLPQRQRQLESIQYEEEVEEENWVRQDRYQNQGGMRRNLQTEGIRGGVRRLRTRVMLGR